MSYIKTESSSYLVLLLVLLLLLLDLTGCNKPVPSDDDEDLAQTPSDKYYDVVVQSVEDTIHSGGLDSIVFYHDKPESGEPIEFPRSVKELIVTTDPDWQNLAEEEQELLLADLDFAKKCKVNEPEWFYNRASKRVLPVAGFTIDANGKPTGILSAGEKHLYEGVASRLNAMSMIFYERRMEVCDRRNDCREYRKEYNRKIRKGRPVTEVETEIYNQCLEDMIVDVEQSAVEAFKDLAILLEKYKDPTGLDSTAVLAVMSSKTNETKDIFVRKSEVEKKPEVTDTTIRDTIPNIKQDTLKTDTIASTTLG